MKWGLKHSFGQWKKPKVVNPSPPEKKVEEKSLKTTDNITDNLTDKSPVDTDQGLENQAEKSEKKGLSAHKANLPQKKITCHIPLMNLACLIKS